MNVLQQACMLSNESFMSTIPDIVPEPQYSKKHIRTMNKLLNKMRDNRYHYFTTGTVRVLIAAAIILSLVVSAFAIPSVREYVITKFNTHSVFRAVSTEDSQYVTDLTVGYIPEGFELVEEEKDLLRYTYTYNQGNCNWITVTKATKKNEVGFDTQEVEDKTIVHNDREYSFYTSNNSISGIIWCDEDYIYQVSCDCTTRELLSIVENIE